MLDLAPELFSRRACAYHYLSMAENNYNRYVLPKESVKLKKYFYVLRPLLNIMWLEEKDSIPPMSFIETVHELKLPQQVHDEINNLLAKKKATSEMGQGPKNPILEEYIQTQLKEVKGYCQTATVGTVPSDMLNDLFRAIIKESWN